ncbi:Multimodular transpeptidase-transglycosylase [hydrothermal vent metagenome]|uniref:Penicillin-binding protein 1A n=1 Tax=hydrothermal vent metagenome TaxID=652676 RepID=A0A3B0S665_9ZZZZ
MQEKRRKLLINLLGGTIATALILTVVTLVGGIYILNHYGKNLPDYTQLADYEPPVVSRIYSGDGSLLAEYAKQKRLYIPISAVPPRLIQAFLSAEDKNFYSHSGLDYLGLLRAALMNAKNVFSNRRRVGASTISQQIAKNFLLSGVQTYERKIKEAILVYRIEKAFTKDQILELYLNKNLMGYGSYGIAAAALSYFNKSVDELELEEMAYLAAVPKAPYNYHPVKKYDRAIGRRNWVLKRMYEEGYITEQEKITAQNKPLVTADRNKTRTFKAEYFTEEVRRKLKSMYGDKELYEGGLFVKTSLSPELQVIAERELKRGLITYDQRHGWRGPIARISLDEDSDLELKLERLGDLVKRKIPLGMKIWQLALVTEINDDKAHILLPDGSPGRIDLDEVKWARQWKKKEYLGPKVKVMSDVLSTGDVIVVEEIFKIIKTDDAQATDDDMPLQEIDVTRTYALRQVPEIDGSLVAMDPHTGRVLAMVGGFDFKRSEYNRATQARRQPGSAFKPFVYAVALENGFTPSSLILDAPFVIEQGFGLGKWKPQNSSNRFYGASTLRLGLEKSRNLMTVRLAQYLKMDGIVEIAERMNIMDDMPAVLSMSLGAGESTLLKMTTAYGMIVNGGKEIIPTLIDRIQDRHGKTIFRHDDRQCQGCQGVEWQFQPEPEIPDMRRQLLDPVTSYQMVSMMEGVVQRGTGIRIKALGKPLAGKTGTSNDSFDTWFIGFSPDLVVGVFVGFDKPRSLGRGEEGSSVAVPIFRDFMKAATRNAPVIPFRIPQGVRLVRVNPKTGQIAAVGEKNTILEAFRQGTFPTKHGEVLDGFNSLVQTKTKLRTGTGGIY